MDLVLLHDVLRFLEKGQPTSETQQFVIELGSVLGTGMSQPEFLEALRHMAANKAIEFEVSLATPRFPRTFTITCLHGYILYRKQIMDTFCGKSPLQDAEMPTPKQSQSQNKEYISLKLDEINAQILLNDHFLVAQPQYDSENYRFFAYLWKNPNREISLEELKSEVGINKKISKILDNLNIKRALRDIFFKTSKTCVIFTPRCSIDDLRQVGQYPIRLFQSEKSLTDPNEPN